MGFLNPAAWLFGALYAVLVALYLWQRQRREVEVPSLLLWQDVPEEVVRSSQFRPDLLFYLQLLILTLLIAGLAQPYFQHGTPGLQPARHVFVLDNSASMAAREGRRSRFDAARDAIIERMASLRDADEVMLITAAQHPRVVATFTHDRAAVLTQLQGLTPTDSGTNLSLALVVAQGATTGSTVPAFVHLFTDVPPSALDPAWLQTADIVQLGETDNNVGIQALDVHHDAFGDYRTAYAHLTVRNFAHREVHGFVSIHVDGAVFSRDGFSLPARESKTFLYQHFTQPGVLEATLETDDALDADNHAYGWLRPERHLRLLVVSGPSALRGELSTIAAAVPNLELRFIAPDAYTPDIALGADVVLFHRFVPTAAPPRPQLYVYPPAGNMLFPVHAHVTDAHALTWNEAHAVWRDLQPATAFPIGHVQLVDTPPWADLLWSADSQSREVALAFSGEHAGQRTACVAFDLAREHLVRPDSVSLLLFFLNVINWLAPPDDAAVVVQTGATQTISGVSAQAWRVVDPHGASAEGTADSPLTIEALYAGVYQVVADRTRQRVLANFFDAEESDIGRPAREPATAPPLPPAHSTAAGPTFSPWLLLAAVLLLPMEWLLARRAA